jgi:hypothetical protein
LLWGCYFVLWEKFDSAGQIQLEGRFSLGFKQHAKRGKCPFFERTTIYSCNNSVIDKPRKKDPLNAWFKRCFYLLKTGVFVFLRT